MEDKKPPIRATLKSMYVGLSVYFPFERYESVAAAVSRLNLTIPGKRWKTSIVKDNPDNDNPTYVRVTRIA